MMKKALNPGIKSNTSRKFPLLTKHSKQFHRSLRSPQENSYSADRMHPIVTKIPMPHIQFGEGPHWLKDQALLFVDVYERELRRHFMNTGRHQTLVIDYEGHPKIVSMAIPVDGEPDLFIVGLGKTLSVVRWSVNDPDYMTAKPIILQTTTDFQFNDAKCDHQGRLWIGTICPLNEKGELLERNTSSFFRYDQNLELTKWSNDITVSNGPAFSFDKKSCYFVDTTPRIIYDYDYDDQDGSLSNRRIMLTYDQTGLELTPDVPDGLTVDTDGNIWIANFRGSKVVCISPKEKKILKEILLPSINATSVCWGGPNYDMLFVTTGVHKGSPTHVNGVPVADAVYVISNLGAKGCAPTDFKPNLQKLKDKMAAYINGGDKVQKIKEINTKDKLLNWQTRI